MLLSSDPVTAVSTVLDFRNLILRILKFTKFDAAKDHTSNNCFQEHLINWFIYQYWFLSINVEAIKQKYWSSPIHIIFLQTRRHLAYQSYGYFTAILYSEKNDEYIKVSSHIWTRWKKSTSILVLSSYYISNKLFSEDILLGNWEGVIHTSEVYGIVDITK